MNIDMHDREISSPKNHISLVNNNFIASNRVFIFFLVILKRSREKSEHGFH